MYKASNRSVTQPKGFTAAGVTCGIKPSGKRDLSLIVSDRPCVAAGVFTQNKLPGAPVIATKRHLAGAARRDTSGGGVRAIVCNSGIANDATGDEGVANALQSAQWVAELVGCDARQVLPASTGVIGPQLPMDKMRRGIDDAAAALARSKSADHDAARGIMTTDLVPKSATKTLDVAGNRITVGGIAKGSGMIAPNMATMLVFITTDAAIDRAALQSALRDAVAVSFNRISVDAHTSPSDMVIVLANGAAGGRTIRKGKSLDAFGDALSKACQSLAYQIVRDGEGATRVFRVKVVNAKSVRDADRIGKTVIDSPLVKTAVHGRDPNWGRIVTAAANSGAALKPANLSLTIGAPHGVCVFKAGQPVALSAADARKLDRSMQPKEVVFTLDLGLGDASADWLGCDLSKEYVRINAEYTT